MVSREIEATNQLIAPRAGKYDYGYETADCAAPFSIGRSSIRTNWPLIWGLESLFGYEDFALL